MYITYGGVAISEDFKFSGEVVPLYYQSIVGWMSEETRRGVKTKDDQVLPYQGMFNPGAELLHVIHLPSPLQEEAAGLRLRKAHNQHICVICL